MRPGLDTRLAHRCRRAALLVLASTLVATGPLSSGVSAQSPARVSALGRIEPRGGITRVAGPSGAATVITELLVEEGDRLEKGQTIAILDSHATRKAELALQEVELANAERQLARMQRLFEQQATSDSELEEARSSAMAVRARTQGAQAQLELSLVRSPIAAQVLVVNAREGERLGPEGIVELGRTDEMYAVAEVYETDVARVKLKQRATVRSPALPEPLTGVVERIGLKVGSMDVLATDPVAKTDARVVEVRIRLDDPEAVSGLTNLQVEVQIEP